MAGAVVQMNAMPLDEGPQCIDVSNDERDWGEVVPDLWFYPDHVLGKELALTIKTAELEQYPNGTPRPFLTFEDEPKRLGLSRENKLILREWFGPPKGCIGKTIVISAGPNAMKTVVIKILRFVTTEQKEERPQLELKPPKPPKKKSGSTAKPGQEKGGTQVDDVPY